MPLLRTSSYKNPPLIQFNGHLQTIIPALTRKIEVPYERERIELDDGDFLNADWIDKKAKRLVILTHGLEGHTDRHYMKGMAKLFSEQNWDVLAWNCRTCGGEMNRNFRMYHHGDIEDIARIVQHALRTKPYEQVALIGFSMGGSITMKYLGFHGKNIPDAIKMGIAISSPCDLAAGVKVLEKPSNYLYKRRFLNSLKAKIEIKAKQFPGRIDVSKFDEIKQWRDFDNFFSAPLNGYRDADDFYAQSSAKNYMAGITIPTLLVNAKNDPILSEACTPTALCEKHPLIYLERPAQGGHVCFNVARQLHSWAEYRALEFVEEMT